MKPSLKKHSGFTLIEMLIAVFIFTVAMAALTLMAGRGIQSSNQSSDRVTAEFLAIESLEAIRNMRDTALITGRSDNSWIGVFGGTNIFSAEGCFNKLGDADQNKTCAVYYNGVNPTLIGCISCAVFFSDNEGYENDSPSRAPGSLATPFVRKVYINQLSTDEIRVRVTVEWDNQLVELEDNLLLWG